MKCKYCKSEMLVDKAIEREDDGVTEFHYKCPNKACSNYGYKDVKATENTKE